MTTEANTWETPSGREQLVKSGVRVKLLGLHGDQIPELNVPASNNGPADAHAPAQRPPTLCQLSPCGHGRLLFQDRASLKKKVMSFPFLFE